MLQSDPKNRYSAKQCLDHPWFKEVLQENAEGGHEKLHAALDNFRKFNSGNRVKQAALGFMI